MDILGEIKKHFGSKDFKIKEGLGAKPEDFGITIEGFFLKDLLNQAKADFDREMLSIVTGDTVSADNFQMEGLVKATFSHPINFHPEHPDRPGEIKLSTIEDYQVVHETIKKQGSLVIGWAHSHNKSVGANLPGHPPVPTDGDFDISKILASMSNHSDEKIVKRMRFLEKGKVLMPIISKEGLTPEAGFQIAFWLYDINKDEAYFLDMGEENKELLPGLYARQFTPSSMIVLGRSRRPVLTVEV